MDRIETTILRNLLNNQEFMRKAYPFLTPLYFHDQIEQAVFKHISTFIDTYSASPTQEAVVISLQSDLTLPEDVYTKSVNMVYDLYPVEGTRLDWLLTETEKFCKERAVHNAIMKSIQIIEGNDKEFKPDALPNILSTALAVCFDTNVGHDYIEDAESRYDSYTNEEETIPFDLKELNKQTGGGLHKKSLTVILAACVHPDTKINIKTNTKDGWWYRTVKISLIKDMLFSGDIYVSSPDGYVKINDCVEKGTYEEYSITVNGKTVSCNEGHEFETISGWQNANQILTSFKNKELVGVLCDDGLFHPVFDIRKTGKEIPIVDIVVDHPNHRYYTNGISSHNTNSGKSAVMCHMAASFISAGLNVLYVSMEMSETKISQRIDANLLGVELDKIKELGKETFLDRVNKIQSKTNGRLIVKEYPTSSIHVGTIRALLDELKLKKDFVPDMIFVDYLNIMLSQRIKGNGNANSYTIVKCIAEELRGLAVEYDLPIVSATQTVRAVGGSSDLDIKDVSESSGLSHTVDILLGWIRTPELDEQNQAMFKLLKSRYSDVASHKPFLVGFDRPKMKLYDVHYDDRIIQTSNFNMEEKLNKSKQPTDDVLPWEVSSNSNFKTKGKDFSGFKM